MGTRNIFCFFWGGGGGGGSFLEKLRKLFQNYHQIILHNSVFGMFKCFISF